MLFKCILGLPQDSIRGLYQLGLSQWLSGKKKKKKNLPANSGDLGLIPWIRKWQPTPVFLPGKSQGQRSLAGYSLWGHKELT